MATNREEIRRQIIEQLDELDDKSLHRLEQLLNLANTGYTPPIVDREEPRVVTRRQLLATLMAGGAILGSSNLAMAWYAREQGEMAGWEAGATATRQEMAAETAKTLQQMQAEIDALRGLVAHYEALERIQIDHAVAQSLQRFETSMSSLDRLIPPLMEGVEVVRGAVDRFEAAVPTIREGMAQVDEVLEAVERRIDRLQEVLSDARDSVADRVGRHAAPVADRLGDFFDDVLSRIPFGLGDRIETVVLRVRQVIEAVPETVASVRDRLLAPLRDTWFAEAMEEGIEEALFVPIRTRVLDPVEELLNDLENVASDWQAEVTHPVQQALLERQRLRQALKEYKDRHGIT